MIINKFLKIINLQWVVRYRTEFSSSFNKIKKYKKNMLIFGYRTKLEKILYENEWRRE